MSKYAAVQPNDPLYLRAAISLIGLSEIEGAKHEKRVLAMYAASGHPEIHDDETPWCAAYIGDCLRHGGLPNTNSLLAISYSKYGTALDKNKTVPRGAIAVWHRPGGNHVNFVLHDNGDGTVTCLGGNQGNGRGGGVTVSTRAKAEAVAFRMPPGVVAPLPKPKPPEPKPEPKPEPAPAPAPAPEPEEPDEPDEPEVPEVPTMPAPETPPPAPAPAPATVDMSDVKGSRTIKGAGVGGVGTVGTVAAESAETIQPIADYSHTIKLIFIGLTLVGIGIVLYARLDDAGMLPSWMNFWKKKKEVTA